MEILQVYSTLSYVLTQTKFVSKRFMDFYERIDFLFCSGFGTIEIKLKAWVVTVVTLKMRNTSILLTNYMKWLIFFFNRLDIIFDKVGSRTINDMNFLFWASSFSLCSMGTVIISFQNNFWCSCYNSWTWEFNTRVLLFIYYHLFFLPRFHIQICGK